MLQPSATIARAKHELGRGSSLSFLGSGLSAALGFALVLVVGRLLGVEGAGVVFQTIAVFMIALGIARFGMDSTALWLLPRLAEAKSPLLRITAWGLVGASGFVGLSVLAVVLAFSALFSDPELVAAVRAAAFSLPLAAMTLTALAATRALGGVGPYVWIGNVLLPALRPLAVMLAVALGAGLAAVSGVWAVTFLPACLLALWVLRVRLKSGTAGLRSSDDSVSAEMRHFLHSPLPRRIIGYAVPRVVSSGLEQMLIWSSVLVVGAVAGAGDAGAYTAASRFIAAGMVVDTAIRVVVTPMFSRLHYRQDAEGLYEIIRTATVWLVLFSAPIFLLLAVFAPVVLSIIGDGFAEAGSVLTVMSAGLLVVLLAGNIHSVLLTAGRSGLAAANKTVAVALNLGLIPVLVPKLGLVGAAWAWVIACAVDAALAVLEVRFVIGLRIPLFAGVPALLIGLLTVAVPAAVSALALGQTPAGLAVAALGSGALFFTALTLGRRRLELDRITATLIPSHPRNRHV